MQLKGHDVPAAAARLPLRPRAIGRPRESVQVCVGRRRQLCEWQIQTTHVRRFPFVARHSVFLFSIFRSFASPADSCLAPREQEFAIIGLQVEHFPRVVVEADHARQSADQDGLPEDTENLFADFLPPVLPCPSVPLPGLTLLFSG